MCVKFRHTQSVCAERFNWALCRWESICFPEVSVLIHLISGRPRKMWHWVTSKIKGAYYNSSISKWNSMCVLLYSAQIFQYVKCICVRVCVGPMFPHIGMCMFSNINSRLVTTLWPLYMCAQSLLGSHRVNRARQTSMLCVCLPANPHTSHPSFRVRYQANEMNTHPQSMGFHLKARGINARPFCTPPTL